MCRGAQILNVALGGTMYQDIGTQIPDSFDHRNWDKYEKNFHEVDIVADSFLGVLYPNIQTSTVCSVHHQSVKTPADDLLVAARSSTDAVVEAVHIKGMETQTKGPWALGVQWHPEWQDPTDDTLLDGRPLMTSFLEAARYRR